jgi:hypothetical protein
VPIRVIGMLTIFISHVLSPCISLIIIRCPFLVFMYMVGAHVMQVALT